LFIEAMTVAKWMYSHMLETLLAVVVVECAIVESSKLLKYIVTTIINIIENN